MAVKGKVAATIVSVALVAGFLVAKGHEVNRSVHPLLRAREVRITGADGSVGVWLRETAEGGSGIWMANSRRTAIVEAGVHGNGFPFLLVSDGAVRNFGLGRVDGVRASPILVFRTDDVVRMVFGLGMIEPQQAPFLVQYTADGQKHDVIGRYCDRPDRVCVR